MLLLRVAFLIGGVSDDGFGLPLIYMLGTWLPIMGLNFIEGRRLMQHLELHHRGKWEELTTFLGIGPGAVNGFRTMPWLYSKDDLGDRTVSILKEEQRQFIRFVLAVFFSYPVFVPLLAI
jgi:hypothetical protein